MLYVRAVIALALPALVDVVAPAWLLSFPGGSIDIGAARFVGVPLLGAGCWLLLDSVLVRFAHEGRCTLAPIDPPRFVVRGGAYRVVRNPMYLSNLAIVVGSGLVFHLLALVRLGRDPLRRVPPVRDHLRGAHFDSALRPRLRDLSTARGPLDPATAAAQDRCPVTPGDPWPTRAGLKGTSMP